MWEKSPAPAARVAEVITTECSFPKSASSRTGPTSTGAPRRAIRSDRRPRAETLVFVSAQYTLPGISCSRMAFPSRAIASARSAYAFNSKASASFFACFLSDRRIVARSPKGRVKRSLTTPGPGIQPLPPRSRASHSCQSRKKDSASLRQDRTRLIARSTGSVAPSFNERVGRKPRPVPG